ncbi:WD40 repeat-like protein [Dendrothele bispora CBS 962.96]|uniref:WD40 repeat-like protein n=1 Tax=Dendrothele bispora (strain CBS 962.96) TaxID=1314807 RepID=A0A4S8L8F0_DENBC|nr:WD40 repeat-like protein [Dendrothele bispora CBS 962.96]
MELASGSFSVPLTFLTVSGARDRVSKSNYIEGNGSKSKSTILASYRVGDESDRRRGSVIGLEDGTILLLRPAQKHQVQDHLKAPVHVGRSSSPHNSPSRASVRSLMATSRSPSPSGHSPAPFSMNIRSRIVSGVTTEQAEAPKNYVDFDEEPDKLKELLKGHTPKERRESSVGKVTAENKAVTEQERGGIKRKEAPRSLLSGATSPALTPKSLSAPSSPKGLGPPSDSSGNLEVLGHVLLPCSGQESSVSALHLLSDVDIIAVLQESGHLSILHSSDGRCLATSNLEITHLQVPEGCTARDSQHDSWIWKTLRAYCAGEYTLLIGCASLDPNSPTFTAADIPEAGGYEQCRVVVLELRVNYLAGALGVTLETLGQLYCDSSSESIGVYWTPKQVLMLYHVNSEGHFVEQKLNILPRGAPALPPLREQESSDSQSLNLTALGPIANPFKPSKRVEVAVNSGDLPQPGRIALGSTFVSEKAVSATPHTHYRITNIEGRLRGLAWSEQELVAFKYEKQSLRVLFACDWRNINDCTWFDNDTLLVAFEEKCELYSLRNAVDPNNDGVPITSLDDLSEGAIIQPKLLQTFPVGPYDSIELINPRSFLVTGFDKNGRRTVKSFVSTEKDSKDSKNTLSVLWRNQSATFQSESSPSKTGVLTAMMPISVSTVVLGFSDGRLRQTTLTKICQNPGANPGSNYFGKVSEVSLGAPIVSLHIAKNERTKERLIVGGGDDGSVAIWNMDLKLCARWTIFITPLLKVIQFEDEDSKTSPLRGCILCISEHGTIAVVAVDGLQYLYLIPGSPSPLREVWLKEDENNHHHLLLFYADRRVRLWDIKTKEFWRSMASEKTEEIRAQGGWKAISLEKPASFASPLSVIGRHDQGLDSVCTLSFDVERFILESITMIKTISTSKNQTANILAARDRLRAILSVVLTPAINSSIDEICQEQLGIHLSGDVSVGFQRLGCTSLYATAVPEQVWKVSGDVSAARALAIVVTLRGLSVFEEFADAAATVITFYTTSLGTLVGPLYQPPDLAFLAQKWFDTSSLEIRQAARTLFDAAVVRLSDDETNQLVNEWQHHLPCLQPTADRESRMAALSLFLCGYLAAEKYSLLSTSALTDIAKSIALYLHDEQSTYRVLAVDLSSRGFHVWQHYIDAMEILRALFALATSAKKENISAVNNVSAQARSAVLSIAGRATGLFMTTLGLDIIGKDVKEKGEQGLEHRKSVLQILAFLIRKRPLVLLPNLPQLLEAVVKSLDPNSTTNRDAVLDTATEILGHVVKTFPSIDFHTPTQRLAVGTSEGAIVMYDLKTAIRLYVLEGHKKSITACSFSPDGRRLVTLSLEESVVLVWKVGSSFSSFFNPGAPPRQGARMTGISAIGGWGGGGAKSDGDEPYKRLGFNVGEEGNMTTAETLKFVNFDWTADRSVKLKIRESVLTFST